MLLLNFAHPLTNTHLARITELAGRDIERLLAISTHFDHAQSFVEQTHALLNSIGLETNQWQTLPLMVNLPSFAPIAAILLAELHGRCGYFPTTIRLRPIAGSVPSMFEVAELLHLQAIRDHARLRR
ncbi:CRISPR-associated protein Csx15 [Gemmata sp. JC673]|uniref:CRISPR-associated protein Csx15 n=1 Tax=Gemmata algarum TaxID=2975278 RepID=A0ABU5F6Q1_9BACT|nr:CRISPR-associated protein Csx15 [Gemmata algarum]MDY3562985.1 CRISPR-associated protein Csx15 [Gemmata algarum]